MTVWSECVAPEEPNYTGETIDTAWLALKHWVAPRVLGRTFAGPEEVFPALQHNFRGHLMAKAALEMGMWALDAERQGLSWPPRLGGTRARIEVGISLGIQTLARGAGRARRARGAGRLPQGEDQDRAGPGRGVRPRRSRRPRARRAAHGRRQQRLYPGGHRPPPRTGRARPHDDRTAARLGRPPPARGAPTSPPDADLPRRIDHRLDRARTWSRSASGRIVNIKPGRVGGFRRPIAIHDFCAAHDIPVWCGGMLESGMGRAYNVALARCPTSSAG